MPLILCKPSFLQNQLLLALRKPSVQKAESRPDAENSSTQLSGIHTVSPTLVLQFWKGPLFSPAMKLHCHLPGLIWANWHEQREP